MAYQQLASVYDRLMIDAPYDQWLAFTKEVFQKSGKKIEKVADLGCGTGEITMRLAKEGYNMTGIDYSSEMLTYAEYKASAANLSIQWIQQDLREYQGVTNIDAAISYCDVINYITTEAELKAVFQRVVDSLKIGGIFIFDIHSLHHVQSDLINKTFTEVTEDVSYIWNCFAGENHGEMYHELTLFTQDEQGKYNRFDETHHQHTYSIDFYKHLLRDVGFEKLNLYSDFSLKSQNPNEKSERIFFVAEKGSR